MITAVRILGLVIALAMALSVWGAGPALAGSNETGVAEREPASSEGSNEAGDDWSEDAEAAGEAVVEGAEDAARWTGRQAEGLFNWTKRQFEGSGD